MKYKMVEKWLPLLSKALVVALGLGVLVVTIAWLSGMFEEKIGPSWTQRSVRKLQDEPTDIVHEVFKDYVEEAIGTLKSSSRTVVSAKILATIDEILVSAGDEVQQGQLLVKLDSLEYDSRLDQAGRALEAAVANREQAGKHFERIQELSAQNVVSRSELEDATRDVQVTVAEEAKARQAVTESQVLLGYTTIFAAKSGRIVDRYAEPGDVAQPGSPLLALYDASTLRLEAPVMEQLAVKLRTGDKLNVYVDAVNKVYEATIDEIVPQADAPSRSFLVKASVPKSEDLYEGMFGRLQIPAGSRRHLCLATDAVIRVGQLEFVDVVLPTGDIERRLIKSGQLGMPSRQEVLSGLEAGERVILRSEPTSTSPATGEQAAQPLGFVQPLVIEQALGIEQADGDGN